MTSQSVPTLSIPSIIADDGLSGVNDAPLSRSDPDRWYFAKDRLDTTPSRKNGIDADKELTYRQQSANFIQDIGQRLQVNQLCINTAIVYMHRFYMFHSFTQFHRNAISAASIFLAAKVEEQPRKLEHVIKVAHYCLHRDHPQMDTKSEQYLEQSAELVMNENILLQTLGFDVAIDHPHTHVVKCCQLVRASKDLAQTSYFMATNSLHLTAMCLQYKPTVVACVCIHLACKWSSWEIPRSKEGKDWFWYVDDTVTTELLEKLTTDFLVIFNKSPSRLKKKINSLNNAASSSLSLTSGPYHGFDSSPSQHHSRSRSPSPKRPGGVQQKSNSNSQQSGIPGKPRPHLIPMAGHHSSLKHPYPPGPPGSSANKHSSHSTSHPPHVHPSSHSSSGKPPHPGMPSGNMKDPHHSSHHSQHPNKPYPPHGHGQHVPHGQYPHGGRPNMQSSSSSSSQSHHGHGMHSKPPVSGAPSSSHQYSSSTSMKNIQQQTHTPSSKPPHNMPPSGAPKMPTNQMPGSVKNPNQSMFHSTSQSHMKKPYEGRPEFGMTKHGMNPGNVHHSQNHSRPPHDKMMSKDGRHHSSAPGMPQSHSSGESRSASHHNLPYLGPDTERSTSSSNPKMPYMESRPIDSSGEVNRHRNIADSKRNIPHGVSTATNGNNNDNNGSSTGGGSGSGASDSHIPSKPGYRPPPGTNSTFGHNSQQDMGAKYNADGFGGEYGSYGSNSTILSIEDRRKRRHAEALSMGSSNSGTGSNNKRPRTDTYAAPIPPLSSNSLFSPEELSESVKRLPPPTSQFSPPAVEGSQQAYNNKASDRSGSINAYSSSDGIVFGSTTDSKADIRRVNPSVEFQAPDLLLPINDVVIKAEPPSHGGSNSKVPRAASLFSPEFTPTNSAPSNLGISLPPTTLDSHKRDTFGNCKVEHGDQQSSSGFSEGSSQVSFTGRLSNSPKRDDGKDGEDSHSSKKSKKKKEKHKHKHKEDKKHKKDKHKDKDREKEKEKEKKDKHRSKDKHSSSSIPTPEVSNDVSGHKIKIKLTRDDGKGSAVQSASRHSSSKANSSSNSTSSAAVPLTSLKVKISNKERVSSVDEDYKFDSSLKMGSPADESTPCCPGFGPCLTCNRKTSQDQYNFFSSMPSQGLTMKIGKNKDSKSSKESSSRDSSKRSKDKTKSTGSSSSGSAVHNSLSPSLPNVRSSFSSSGNHHLHKNGGMEKSSKKKEKPAAL